MRIGRYPQPARLAGLLIVAGAVAAAPGAVAAASAPASSAATLGVTLSEWRLVASQPSVRAGRVTFVVRNSGTLAHEFVVLRSDRAAGRLPVKAGRAVETGVRGELARIGVGATRRLTVSLRAGRYVLICNLLGHYQAGQFAAIRAR